MLYFEDDYLSALAKFSNLKSKIWLLNYFELYKSTLNWPVGSPPINRSNLITGTLRDKFNSTYFDTLSEFEYELDNEKQTLIIKNKGFWL
jgi:hypothetical protein